VADGKLPALDGRRVVRALTRSGFVTDRLMEGASVEDPPAFAARLRRVMEKALG
jgi:hypothetical protein